MELKMKFGEHEVVPVKISRLLSKQRKGSIVIEVNGFHILLHDHTPTISIRHEKEKESVNLIKSTDDEWISLEYKTE
jgi:hypothetical protein